MKPLVIIIAMILASCGDPNDEAIRHLVIAELIQQEKVPESQVQIVSVRFSAEDKATVDATIRDLATKGSAPAKQMTCLVERQAGRWRVTNTSLGSR